MAQATMLARSLATVALSRNVQVSESSLKVQPFSARQLSSLHGSSVSSFAAGSASQVGVARSGKVFALFKSAKKEAPKKDKKPVKSSTEDGIFGTSGGIGFTKANELFVGRVAMLGFSASILGEALTGKGTLAQFDVETGIPLNETEPLLLFFILFTLLGAIGALGDRGKFVDDDVDEANTGGVIPPGKGFKAALGLNQKGPTFGFTKANELFVGRLAQLGIAFSIIGEIITGKGTLAQLNIETGLPITELEPLILFNVIFFFLAAINPGTGKFINDDDIEE
ncbi:photosystem II 22kDa protein [Marchantia polymorpha subsp. ruderalis]|uniref:Uncharacterized protein n=2 Tax=Marchantia polymorpha TaxID=3197 RepID=A0A176WDR9_MARPO|nr:hypothetical protein AXG93_424s1050 [Marchantia polymorpha subsp. ruderalis]PTQ46008.1 hypothetical protein MARPO_0013s0199 [Marchantia polymorpha]BBN18836.1 hypothetical protein Mp_8g05910 [Marchantia polymorpha subsp. ruderalis]|eukprot:PTQ46008.1 hypothetical protein MARPO_0013s0199 [Marchantia polymorpha]